MAQVWLASVENVWGIGHPEKFGKVDPSEQYFRKKEGKTFPNILIIKIYVAYSANIYSCLLHNTDEL